jgi:hypothetical protein
MHICERKRDIVVCNVIKNVIVDRNNKNNNQKKS